jgi:hypothetical protein
MNFLHRRKRLLLICWRGREQCKCCIFVKEIPQEGGWYHHYVRYFWSAVRGRIPSPSNKGSLLIVFITSPKTPKDKTLTRWRKSVLERAGVDAGNFGAHSTRSAAASDAVNNWIPYDSVLLWGLLLLLAGNWLNRFYSHASLQILH